MRTDRWPAVVAAALAAACGGSKEPPPPPPTGTFTLSGTVSYDSVPAREFGGLSYAATVPKPVRGAVVEVVTGTPATALGSGTTGPLGQYSITWTGTSAVALRVKAQTLSPPMRVQDNTNQGALYALDSGPVDAAATAAVNLRARSGWTGTSYGAPRAAAPFAILDAMLSAAGAFSAVRSPAFPELRLNWSVNNRPQGGDISAGYIGTSHYNPATQQLYILGQANVDTDEYDSHVIVHEWGHYYEDRLSRSDSPGGPHGFGDQKDPRLAFSEGWGNALGAMVLYPDDAYADTMSTSQATTGIYFSLEANTADDAVPGWWSEMSVAHFLYDLFDPAPDGDAVELGLGPIHDVMVGEQRITPAFTTLFSFLATLKAAQSGAATAIDAMLSGRAIASPVLDRWGTGETHAAWAPSLPVYRSLTVNGGSTTVSFLAGYELNDLHQSRFLRFGGTGGAVTVRAGSATVDVSLEVWHLGQRLAFVDANVHGEEIATPIPTVAGGDYLVFVNGWETTGSLYSVPVSVTSP
jgi:hypothetical protein